MTEDVSESEATAPRARPGVPPPRPPSAAPDDATPAGVRAPQRASKADVLDNLPTTALGQRPPVAGPRELPPGIQVGRYLIVEHVGAGGLGDVYKAYDPELDRRIAIKLLRAEVVDANRRLGDPTDRLRREAQALAKLRHPNVVAVHDVGTFDGEVFIAMEFANGQTLLPWARAHGHDWRAIREVFVRAGEGLAAAHDAGLVHRDFKPANVMVAEDRHVTVLDFGLARSADRPVTDGLDFDGETESSEHANTTSAMTSLLSQEVTGGSLLLGTPPYMAPELYESAPATNSSDQFAFCVSLYRVLFNRLPFVARSPSEFCAAVAKGELNFAGNSIPGWLQRLIARGLAAKPEHRFENMAALLTALVTDRRRRRSRWIGLSILVPLAGVATAVGAWALRPPPSAAELDRTEQLSTDARAAAARGFYVHPPPDAPSTPTALTKVLELEALEGAVADEADTIAAALRGEFADALIRLGDRYYERDGGAPFAADFYATALVFTPDNAHAGSRVALSDAQLATLVAQAKSGSFSERELAAAQPLAILAARDDAEQDEKLREFLANDQRTPARTRTMLEGLVRQRPRRVAAASDAPPPSAPTPVPAVEPDPVPVADILLEPDALEDGPPASPSAASERAPTPAVDAKKRAAVEAKQGVASLKQGDLTQAASHFHRALKHDRRNFSALDGLFVVHYERGEFATAVRYGERARAVSPRDKQLLLLLGDAHLRTLDYDKAREVYERAKKLGAKQADERLSRLAARLGE